MPNVHHLNQMVFVMIMMMELIEMVPLGQVGRVYSQGELDRQVPHSGSLERLGTPAPSLMSVCA